MERIVVLLALIATTWSATPSIFVTREDQARFVDLFQSSGPGRDVESAYYAFQGLNVLRSEYSDSQTGCAFLKDNMDSKSLESIFFAASASTALKGCQLDASSVQSTLQGAIVEGANSKDLYHAILALKQLKVNVDVGEAQAALLASVRDEGTAMGHAYSFYAAAAMGGDVSKFVDNIEDAIAQADEVDGTYLRFESGLVSTAFVVESIFRLAEVSKKSPPALTEGKLLMLTNYLLTGSKLHNLRGAFHVISALQTLASNSFQVPIAVSKQSSVSVSLDQPLVQIRITDVMGNDLGAGFAVTADSTKHLADQAVIISKKPLTSVKGDNSLFEMNLMESKPRHGFYHVSLSVTPPEGNTKLRGLSTAEVAVKVVVPASVASMEVGVADRDQATVAKSTKLQHPGKAANAVEADHHQKIVMRFTLKDDIRGERMRAHQAFIRFENKKTEEEVIFRAELKSDLSYEFELDVGKQSDKFGHRSGTYRLELLVGDAVIQNPFVWHLADAKLSFNQEEVQSAGNMEQYKRKPEIKHLFRDPEKRPPVFISSVFSALVLLPLIIMLLLWLRLGVNINNFSFSLSYIGFHIGLAAIFGLYYCYWTELNMFGTMKWLAVLAVPTFLCGNRMLAGMAARRKKSS